MILCKDGREKCNFANCKFAKVNYGSTVYFSGNHSITSSYGVNMVTRVSKVTTAYRITIEIDKLIIASTEENAKNI